MRKIFSLLLVSLSLSCGVAGQVCADPFADKNAEDMRTQKLERNPYLAESDYPMIHAQSGQSGYASVSGPRGPSRQLAADEIIVNRNGSLNGAVIDYSGPYPNGKRVIWAGGPAKVVKMDADTLATLAEMKFEVKDVPNLSETEIEAANHKTDTLHGNELYDFVDGMLKPSALHAGTVYRIVDKDNDMYMLHNPDLKGPTYIRVFGDATPGDPKSAIVIKREWKMPENIAPNTHGVSLNMTYDGWVVAVTHSGVLFVVSRDFKKYYSLQLPGSAEAAKSGDNNMMTAYVRNGLAVDRDGGIYIIATDTLFRVQWTGKGLSLNPADGAWSINYPNDAKLGSGGTPVLIGFGDKQDKLIVITDGNYRMSVLAYWRNAIPADWQGLHGQPRRMAGTVPVTFGDDDPNIQIRSEDAPIGWGYGVFVTNSQSPTNINTRQTRHSQWLAENYEMLKPGYTPHGGMKAEWDPARRTFTRTWVASDISFADSVCTVSGGSKMVYCEGVRDGKFTLEGVDWNTGKSAFYYVLGSSQLYNLLGGCVSIAPNGDVDFGMHGGFSNVRIKLIH